jgi:hypothetical protein
MTAIANHPHRVTSAVADARTSLASVNDVPLWSMDPDETTATIDRLASLAAQVAELQTRLLSHADRAELPVSPAPPRPPTGTPTAPARPDPPRTG